MTTGRTTAWVLVLALVLSVAPIPAAAAPAARGDADADGVRVASRPPDPGDDPRLRRTGGAERAIRGLGDAVLVRPFLLVQLVAGIAVLPVVLPVAAAVADWRDALDLCVAGPYEMVFERPLGG